MGNRMLLLAALLLLSPTLTAPSALAQSRAPAAEAQQPVRGSAGTLPTRTSTSPALKRLTDRSLKSSDADKSGPQRSRATKAGVLDTSMGKKLEFDPKKLGKKSTEEIAQEKLSAEAEDIIEWKSNFEKGVKCQKIPLDVKVRLDFNEVPLGELTKFISCITERNFILTGSANKNATVSILSPKPVTVYEAYKAYLSALEANGLTIITNGEFHEIVASGEARQAGTDIYRRGRTPKAEDIMVTRLIQLEHVEAQEILPVLDKFKSKSADVTIYGPTNTLILTDTGTNIRRIQRLLTELDVPVSTEKIWIRPIQYADAKEVLSMLQTLFGTKGAAGKGGKGAKGRTKSKVTSPRGSKGSRTSTVSPSTVIGGSDDVTSVQISTMLSDERTNSIILVANRTSYLRLDRLIRKLDVPIPGEGQIHIHALENAEAEEIAQTLTSLAGGSKKKSGKSGRKSKKSKSSSGGAVGQLLEGEVKVTAYKPTNSLVIEASLKDYMSLQRVIRQLDVRRKQVYVEAVIMEISQNKQRDLGLSGSAGTTIDVEGETLPLLFGVGGMGLDIQSALQTLGDGGGAIGLQGPMLDVSGGAAEGAASGGTFSIPAFGFLLKALQTTSNVNVLSTPHILTVENEEAEIQVGKRQPYRNSSVGGLGGLSGLAGMAGLGGGSSGLGGLGALGGLGGLGGLGSSVQYVDVDLTLKIKPQVNASDYIRLEIDQSIDDIDGFFAEAPITSKRKIQNVVVVRDGQPVVIGGLMRDQETKSTEKVPFLGDIPLIGLAFRRTSTKVEKRNLLLVIIPHVIKDPSDLKRIHDQRRDEYREFAKSMAQRKKEYSGDMDYRKKTGLLQEMHSIVGRAQRDRELREAVDFENRDRDLVGPPESHDIEYMPPIPDIFPDPAAEPAGEES
jgi:general secretion pathway protein D